MYMATALVYLIVAGAPPDAPLAFNSRITFPSEAHCQAYLKSPQYEHDKAVLIDVVRRALLSAETENVEVAVTTSCTEDNRV